MGGAAAAVACDAAPNELVWETDRFDGAIVDPESLADEPSAFKKQLEAAERAWRERGTRGVWLKVPTAMAHLIGIATEAFGFEFHHAEPGYAMLCRWLPTDEPNMLPPNASHQVGIGAVVLNRYGELLVVQERHGPLRGTGVWKVPTGLINCGEHVSDGAAREVLEETGVHSRFDCVLAVRQAHGFLFGKSDLFFLCGLVVDESACEMQPDGRPKLVAQPEELEGCRWMPLEEYAAQEWFRSNPGGVHVALNAQMRRYRDGAEGSAVWRGRQFQRGGRREVLDLLLTHAAAEADPAAARPPTDARL